MNKTWDDTIHYLDGNIHKNCNFRVDIELTYLS